MLKMSFFNGTLDKEKAIKFIQETKKPCVFTVDLSIKILRFMKYISPKKKRLKKLKLSRS